MADSNSKNKIYILTIEYNSDSEEIEYIAEEIIDDKDFLTHVKGTLDIEEHGWDIEALEFMREHYMSGEA
tara:strand:- start:707 stop:916 length:210 start_codon:yes stop_codon:yes gene_type:complete